MLHGIHVHWGPTNEILIVFGMLLSWYNSRTHTGIIVINEGGGGE